MSEELRTARRSLDTPPTVPGHDVGELIGVGSSATVWAATPTGGDELVAVKIIDGDEAAVAAARQEAHVLSTIEPGNVVRLLDSIPLADGRLALVLDLMAGGSLRGVLASRGHLTPGECATVLTPLASVVGRLHRAGVVHSDISPGNVLFDAQGQPHLADLGSARVAGAVEQEVRGTVGYTAPEVEAGAAAGPAADVYALGALGWFALTGHEPGPAVLRGELSEAVAPELREHPLTIALAGALARDASIRPDADSLAVAVFDAAEPEPLPLLAGRDDVAVLTHRIRAAQRAQETTTWRMPSRPQPLAADGAREGRRRRPPRSVSPSTRSRRRAEAGDGGLRRVLSLRDALRRVPRVALVLAAAVAVIAGLAGLARVPMLRDASAESAESAVAQESPVSAVAAGAIEAAGAPPAATHGAHPSAQALTDPDAVRERPEDVVLALAHARAAVWSSGLARRLTDVDAPRSPALQRDTEQLAEVQRIGGRYTGLTLTPREVALVSVGSDAAVVRATVDASAYRVAVRGDLVERPAVPGSPLLLHLRWTTDGWRVHDVAAPE